MTKFLKSGVLCLFILGAAACEKATNPTGDNTTNNGREHEDSTDYVWTAAEVVPVILDGNTATANNSGVMINGGKITITAGGTYDFTGTLTSGQIEVNSSDKKAVRLILDGASVTSASGPAIYVADAKKVILIMAVNKINTVTDGASYPTTSTAEDAPNAAIFSMADLTLFGEGSLNVKGNYQDGISGKDGLIIKSGTISVTSVDDGIRGKDYLIIEQGTVTVKCGGQGLKSDNVTDTDKGYVSVDAGAISVTSGNDALHSHNMLTINGGKLTLSAGDDGIHAETSVEINNGEINITKSVEGIESATITVNDGAINLVSSDDGFNATHGVRGENNDGSWLNLNGGSIYVNSSKGDGLDSNGSISVTRGTIIVHGPLSQPEVGMDYNGTCNVTGGFLVVSGVSSNMTQAIGTGSSQYGIRATAQRSLAAGTLFHIQDADGNDVLTFKPLRSYSSVVFTSPALKSGSTYTLYTGGTSSGTEKNGLIIGGTYSGGTQSKTFTISGKVTGVTF